MYDLVEIEAFCEVNYIDCFGCTFEDACFDSFMIFGCLHASEFMEHFTKIIYAEGEI